MYERSKRRKKENRRRSKDKRQERSVNKRSTVAASLFTTLSLSLSLFALGRRRNVVFLLFLFCQFCLLGFVVVSKEESHQSIKNKQSNRYVGAGRVWPFHSQVESAAISSLLAAPRCLFT